MRSLVRGLQLALAGALVGCGVPSFMAPASGDRCESEVVFAAPAAAVSEEACVAEDVGDAGEAVLCATPLACARIVAARIRAPGVRAEYYQKIAEAALASGDLALALELAEVLRDPGVGPDDDVYHGPGGDRMKLLAAIATAAAPDSAVAREALGAATAEAEASDRLPRPMTSESYPTARHNLAAMIAEGHLAHGRLAAARTAADGAMWRQRVDLLLTLAERTPDRDERLAALAEARDSVFPESWAFIAVARGYFKAGRAATGDALLRQADAAARATADAIISRDVECLGDVAAAYAESDRLLPSPRAGRPGLRKALRLAQVREPSEGCLDPLLTELIQQREFAALLQVVGDRTDLGSTGVGLRALAARGQGQLRREAALRASFLRSLRDEPDLRFRVDAILALAGRYRDAGLIAGALALVELAAPIARKVDDDERDYALRLIAEAYAANGRCDEAVAVTREQDDEAAFTLSRIAEQCTDLTAVEASLAARSAISEPHQVSSFLGEVARLRLKRGELRRALELVPVMTEPIDRVKTLLELHLRFVEAADPELIPLQQRAAAP